MASHKRDGLVSERLSQRFAQFVIADQHVGHARDAADLDTGTPAARNAALW